MLRAGSNRFLARAVSLLTLLMICVGSTEALAVEQTLACRFQEGSDKINQFNEVDQIRLDPAANLAELRVARTMGTSVPVNWIFTNRKTGLGTDSFSISEQGGGTFGAGIYGEAAHSFALKYNGDLLWVIVMGDRPIWFKWHCQR